MQVGEELLDAELKHDSQAGVVGLEQDANSVDFFVVRDVR